MCIVPAISQSCSFTIASLLTWTIFRAKSTPMVALRKKKKEVYLSAGSRRKETFMKIVFCRLSFWPNWRQLLEPIIAAKLLSKGLDSLLENALFFRQTSSYRLTTVRICWQREYIFYFLESLQPVVFREELVHVSLDEGGLPAAQLANHKDLEEELPLGLVREVGPVDHFSIVFQVLWPCGLHFVLLLRWKKWGEMIMR